MPVELILAACTECGRPTFPHAECGSGYTFSFFLYYEIIQSIVYQQIELCGYLVC